MWPVAQFWLSAKAPPFNIPSDGTLFDADGKKHPLYGDFATFSDAMLMRSTGILWQIGPIQELVDPLVQAHLSGAPMPPEPQWAYAHTLDVARDEVYVRVGDERHRVDAFTIYGQLKWEHRPMLYCVMEKVPTGEVFAGALIGQSDIPGQMWAFIFSAKEDRMLETRQVQLEPKHLNSIRKLRLALPEDNPTAS